MARIPLTRPREGAEPPLERRKLSGRRARRLAAPAEIPYLPAP